MRTFIGLIVLTAGFTLAARADPATKPFAIHVIDDQTGHGVPLVALKTVSNVSFWTDSAGYAAIDDPALLGRRVFFSVWSHGYEFPKDGFGYRGKAIDLATSGGSGGEATLKIKRLNIAERLYRITGEGIYRDSVMLGKPVPIAAPLLNGQVTGQDSVLAAVYGGKIWWFWGDTNRQAYPLGHYSTAGATSELPGKGGLDPSVGVDLTYFVNKEGFSRPMAPPSNQELHWVFGLAVVKDDENGGAERLIATNTRLKSLSQPLGREVVVMDDRTATFEAVRAIDLKSPHLRGHPFHHVVDGVDYLYWGEPYPCQRVKADFKSATDPANYEAYLPRLPRDVDGKLRWAWQKGAAPLDVNAQERKISAGEMKADETPFRLCDVAAEGGGRRFIRAQFGSVNWNAFRKKWVMIFVEQGGKPSFLGEIWYAEADAPQGPWRTARKIVTHDRYSFYNPVHHAFFDQEGGRYIYFQGTYTTTFSRESDTATPRYDYNQIMYRLDLADERLHGGSAKEN